MNDTLQIKAGIKARLPALAQREFGYCTDTRELYIGTSAGNARIASAGSFDELTGLTGQMAGKLTAVPAASVAPLAAEVELATAVEKINELISVLQVAGIMKGGNV